MDQTEIREIVDELRRKHPDPAGQGDLSDLELTLGLLPDQSVWRVADLTPAVYALAPGDRLFTITLGDSPDPGLPRSVALLLGRIGRTAAPGVFSTPGEFGAPEELSAPGGSAVPGDQEPPSSEPSGPSRVARQQVTDIWGYPIDKRGGRRR